MKTERKVKLGAPEADACEAPSLAGELGAAVSSRMNERIRKLRLTNATVATRSGYAESTIRKWRKGGSVPGLTAIHALAAALDVSPEWLSGGAGSGQGAHEIGAGAARDGCARQTGRSVEQDDVRVFFGVVRAVERLDTPLDEGQKADIAMRVRYGLAAMARDQDRQSRLDQADLDEMARIALKLI